jgi:hypothetical protein
VRICDLHTGISQLTQALADLKDGWIAAGAQWNDAARKQFEEEHLQPLPAHIQRMMIAAQRLSEVVEKAQRDCEDRTLET